MKLLRNTRIATMSKRDILRLFANALDGTEFLVIDYDHDFYESMEKDYRDDDGDTILAKTASVLLKGGNALIFDIMSDGDVHSRHGETVRTEKFGDCTLYKIRFDTLKQQLENCCNGCYDELAQKAFDRFADDDPDFDHEDAERLMQYVLFGEEVYV